MVVRVSALLLVVLPSLLGAQTPHRRWEIPGLDFRRDGVLRTYARTVRMNRARLLASRQFGQLNAPLARIGPVSPSNGPELSATTVSGVLTVPAMLFRFKDSPVPPFDTASYNAVLFAASPPVGRPYTYRSFYQQMSDGLFDIQGRAVGYATLDSTEDYYNGGTSSTCAFNNLFAGSSNCNGIFSNAAFARLQTALDSVIRRIDATIDFSQYVDPVSGFVPLVLFIDQAMGGECGPSAAPENHLWAHRSALSPYTTQDDWPGHAGQKVRISDYILQSGFGGLSACTAGQIMPIGTVAHETGHGLGLPDLYDVTGATEGVGQWSLMSSGSFTSGLSPARMDAWSLNELGWTTLIPADTTGVYRFDASALTDTTFYVRVQNPNPRGEYFLLENRQRQQSDTAMIRIHCQHASQSASCPGGLLMWHVDSTKFATSNNTTLQAGSIHGLAVVQADAFGNLDAVPQSGNFCPGTSTFAGCSNRGDAGDLYPGALNNRSLRFLTAPAAAKNVDRSFAGFAVDSIQQLVADRTLSFRLRFGALTIVRASDTTATVQVETASGPLAVFRDMLEEGRGYQVQFADSQLANAGRKRFRFVSWSDGGAITHTYVGQVDGDTLIANVARDFKLIATSGTGGTIQADTAIDLSGGTFIVEGHTITLTATPDSGTFGGWSGDTVTTNAVLALPMGRPYTVFASFGTLAIASATARPDGVMGAAYADTLRATGGTGSNSWAVTSGAMPLGLNLSPSTGIISGFPRQVGNFSYTVTLTSGAQNQAQAFSMSVTAPTLTTADVVAQLLGTGAPLTAHHVRYLDFLGNNNSGFDIGDFLAWVKATGASLSAAMDMLQRKGGSR